MAVREKESAEKLPAYKPARSIESVTLEYGYKGTDIIKLAGNENRFGCSPKVLEAINEQSQNFSFYPDMNVTELRNALSEKHNIPPENIIFGNGSFEIISLIGAAYIDKGDEAIYNDPSFGWYKNVTRQNQGTLVKIPVTDEKSVDTDAILSALTDRAKVIWLCNPNNPTGTLIPADVLADFIGKVPENILIALDEAYVDFIDGDYPDTVEFVRSHDNIILLRTFSKAHGLASFRIGYGIADKKIISALSKVKLPLNVSRVSQTAALAALKDTDFTDFIIKTNREQLQYYYSETERLGLRCIRSHGNFLLVNIGIDSSFAEREFLRNGIVIRNGEEFGLPQWLRISVGKPEENQKVIAALEKILKESEK